MKIAHNDLPICSLYTYRNSVFNVCPIQKCYLKCPPYYYILYYFSSNQDAKVLITIGEGKFFSNGLDLERMKSFTANDFQQFEKYMKHLIKKMLTFPLITIAALNGNGSLMIN